LLVIGIIWVNHHTMFSKVDRVDRRVLFANLILLLFVSALPFPTRLLAEHLTAGSDANTAAPVHSATMLAMGVAFSALRIAVTRDVGLLNENVDAIAGRAETSPTSPRSGCPSSTCP